MPGNPFYGRGAYDAGVKFAAAVEADKRARMRIIKIAVVMLVPAIFSMVEANRTRRSRAE